MGLRFVPESDGGRLGDVGFWKRVAGRYTQMSRHGQPNYSPGAVRAAQDARSGAGRSALS